MLVQLEMIFRSLFVVHCAIQSIQKTTVLNEILVGIKVMHVYRISKSSTCKQEERVWSTSNEENLSGKISFHPKLTFCYKSIKDSLQELLCRIELCEEWRKSTNFSGVFNDIYDGKVWKDFQSVNGQPFLSAPFNYAFHLKH